MQGDWPRSIIRLREMPLGPNLELLAYIDARDRPGPSGTGVVHIGRGHLLFRLMSPGIVFDSTVNAVEA